MAQNDLNTEMSMGGDPKSGPKFERGNPLSIFVRDRNEDMTALLFAFLIAVGSFMFFS